MAENERLTEAFGEDLMRIIKQWPQLSAEDIREIYENEITEVYAVYDNWEDVARAHLERGDCEAYIRPFIDMKALAKYIAETEWKDWTELNSGKLIAESKATPMTKEQVDRIARAVYNNAISQVFTKEAIIASTFNSCCYKQMIDNSHSIVIWGNCEADDNEVCRDYLISIREGASEYNEFSGEKQILREEAIDCSYSGLYDAICRVLTRFFNV